MSHNNERPSLSPALHIDLYELTMAQIYWRKGLDHKRAVFSLFFRGYPQDRAFYIAAGIEDAIDFLSAFRFTARDLEHLRSLGIFAEEFVEYLAQVSFRGSVRALREGSIVFAQEPLLEVTAPIIQAQLVETMLLNIITAASLFATKGIRIVEAACGRPVFDFGSRRTHGIDAGIDAARYGYLSGFHGTSNVRAAALHGIPAIGTMAHSFVLAFPDETSAFIAYAEEFPEAATLLVDTYDTTKGVKKAIATALQMKRQGTALSAIRIDSGHLDSSSRAARRMLDAAGLRETRIIVSGGLDEHGIHALMTADAPIDAFGVGTRFSTSSDAPFIDSAYKLVELDGMPVAKLSEGKNTMPWSKQLYRTYSSDGMMEHDLICRNNSPAPDTHAEPMLHPVMRDGRRVVEPATLDEARQRVRDESARLPAFYRRLHNPHRYPLKIAPDLVM